MGRNKEFDRNEVLEKAIQLFWRKGYSETSLSDLEKATGVNKSGLYSEFKNKDDIFLESLKYYKDHSPAHLILSKEPFGWDNIENFLKAHLICKGQKGCFLNNTVREYSIIPSKVKLLLEENAKTLHDLLLKNIMATDTKQNPEILTKMILTFGSGVGLKLNAVKAESLNDEIEAFLKMIKY